MQLECSNLESESKAMSGGKLSQQQLSPFNVMTWHMQLSVVNASVPVNNHFRAASAGLYTRADLFLAEQGDGKQAD